MTRLSAEPPANRWLPSSGSLSTGTHIRYAASLVAHLALGTIALLISVVTALDDNLAPNQRQDVNNAQLWLAIFLWTVALAALGILWARRFRWGWLAPLIWALIGIPLAVTHAQVETVAPRAACAADGRIALGMSATGQDAPPVAWCFDAGNPIREVAARGDTVFLASSTGDLTALSASSGTTQWMSEPGAASGAFAVGADVVVGGGDANVTAWNSAGEQLWTAATPGPVTSLAISDRNEILVACADGTVLALDGTTGRIRWVSLTPVTNPEIAIAGPNVYAFNAPREITVAVLDVASGEIHGAWIYDLGPQTYLTSPILVGTTLVAGYDARPAGAPRTGGAIGMDPENGAIRWDRPLEAPVQVAPVNVSGTAHVLALNGQLYRIETISGQDIQPREIVESHGSGSPDANRLLATDGTTVYIGQPSDDATAGDVYDGVITATYPTGSALWRFRLTEPPTLPVVVAGSKALVQDGTALFAILQPASESSNG